MAKEIEARFINLSPENIEGRFASIGAKKIGEYFLKEWIFAYPDWFKDHRRIRVRTDGTNTWLTYKANATWEVDSTEEIETEVSSAEEIVKVLKAISIPLLRYQEKKRIRHKLRDIVFEMDFWQKIPMVLEIEAPSVEEVKEGVKLFDLDWKDAIFEDQREVHEKYYGIDLNKLKEYRFTGT